MTRWHQLTRSCVGALALALVVVVALASSAAVEATESGNSDTRADAVAAAVLAAAHVPHQDTLTGTDAVTLITQATTNLSQRRRRRSSRDRKKDRKGDRERDDERDDDDDEPRRPVMSRGDDTYPRMDPNQRRSESEHSHGVSDENWFDEAHQRDIARMYGQQRGEGAAVDDTPIEPDPENPYSFPGMTPNEGPDDWDYAITIDCGSKGSRAHIYKWQHRHSATSIPPFSPLFTKHAWSVRVAPGIASFVDSPERAIPQMVTLLEFARNSLSAFRYKWNRTPVYVKATAGMRLIKNLPSRDRIIETIRTFLSDRKTNPFYFERSMARVISGEEEGVYGWMTTAYLTNTLMHSSSATSYGALDMGGASVQITFRPPFDVLSNYFPLRLQQERIRLYSHSFLNFGIERALQRVNDRLIELGNGTTGATTRSGVSSSFFIGVRDGVRVFRHPCFPLGFSFTYVYVSTTDLGASYGGQRNAWTGDAGDGADLSPITTYSEENAEREMVQFEGGQDFGNCSAITWQLLHKKGACFDNTCSFNGIYQPRFGNVTFLAFSEFSKVVTGDLGLPRNATLAQIDRRTHEICNWNWQRLQDIYRYASIDDLSKLCFNARYIFTVLYKGFGFPYEGQNLIFVRNLLDLDLSWALGSTLYETNAMPWDIDGRHGDETFRYHLGDQPTTPPGTATKAEAKLDKKQQVRDEKADKKEAKAAEKQFERESRRAGEDARRSRDDDCRPTEGAPSQPSEALADPEAPKTAVAPPAPAPSDFLLGGWLVTAISYFLSMRAMRGDRYEPIPA